MVLVFVHCDGEEFKPFKELTTVLTNQAHVLNRLNSICGLKYCRLHNESISYLHAA